MIFARYNIQISVNIQNCRQIKDVSLTLLANEARTPPLSEYASSRTAYTNNFRTNKEQSSLRFSKKVRTVSLNINLLVLIKKESS